MKKLSFLLIITLGISLIIIIVGCEKTEQEKLKNIISNRTLSDKVRCEAVKKLEDQDQLVWVAKKYKSFEVRKSAIKRLKKLDPDKWKKFIIEFWKVEKAREVGKEAMKAKLKMITTTKNILIKEHSERKRNKECPICGSTAYRGLRYTTNKYIYVRTCNKHSNFLSLIINKVSSEGLKGYIVNNYEGEISNKYLKKLDKNFLFELFVKRNFPVIQNYKSKSLK